MMRARAQGAAVADLHQQLQRHINAIRQYSGSDGVVDGRPAEKGKVEQELEVERRDFAAVNEQLKKHEGAHCPSMHATGS